MVVVGDPSEAALADRVVAAAHARLGAGGGGRVRSLAGRLDLPGLVGVLAAADVVLANDSGPRHLAQAVGARTVGIFVFGNTINAMPFGRARHRIRLGRITRCPVCGRDATQVGWTAARCEHDPSYVADVPVADVLEDVRGAARRLKPSRGSRWVTAGDGRRPGRRRGGPRDPAVWRSDICSAGRARADHRADRHVIVVLVVRAANVQQQRPARCPPSGAEREEREP